MSIRGNEKRFNLSFLMSKGLTWEIEHHLLRRKPDYSVTKSEKELAVRPHRKFEGGFVSLAHVTERVIC